MLQNIEESRNLQGLARAKNRIYTTKTIKNALAEEELSQGWIVDKHYQRTTRIKKGKPHYTRLEDRVWLLLYRMGFTHLSSAAGAVLVLDPQANDSPKTKIDVVGLDDEIALAIECKSSERLGRRPQFQEELGKFALVRQRFAAAANSQFKKHAKRQVVLAMFLSKIHLSENDKKRAREHNILLFDDHDLDYYERLVKHTGIAAKYQLFCEMLPKKSVPGLEIKLPAIRTRIGGAWCYSFCISPAYLLKIAYVSHRLKGKGADIDTYQRMVKKRRLDRIREYISDGGIFPTNIVINLDKKRLEFHRIGQDARSKYGDERGVFGWLTIRPSYKSAWIIDGQHRLLAYSGHEKAEKDLLPVLAFEALKPSQQANLFVEINSKQKAVRKSLLDELFAELKWDSDDPKDRVAAIISKTYQRLNIDPESALYGKIMPVDSTKDAIRCISLTSLCGATEKCNFYIHKTRRDHVLEYGAFWQGDSQATLRRTTYIIDNWLNLIKGKTSDWWSKGAGEGGGLSMNEGVMTLIRVLGTIIDFLEGQNVKLIELDNEDLFECVKRYGAALGDYLSGMSEDDRNEFRRFRAEQGIKARVRRCQKGIRDRIPDFNPTGLDKFLEEEKAQTNKKAREIVEYIEVTLQRLVLEELQREFGPDQSQWWVLGIPKQIRIEATNRWEEDNRSRGEQWHYLDLIDYRRIASANWTVFQDLLGYGKGSKDRRTHWMKYVSDIRNALAHFSSGVSVSIDQLNQLQEYRQWLKSKISGESNFEEQEQTQDMEEESVVADEESDQT
ncbi:MAG: DGQHR domain-containing protein [Candidatus Thorarchaeota archaeon]|nr:DGQHR domain-containing protein [Candidatus Thorarchaeota archaeon]